MTIRILLISDIHGNYPALKAVDAKLDSSTFHYIVNSGDSVVYAPFPNETLAWLIQKRAISILGNTDKKVIKLLAGKSFKKPRNPEKRIMYSSTTEILSAQNSHHLLTLPKTNRLKLKLPGKTEKKQKIKVGIFHGSPADHDEFLFADSPDLRFHELSAQTDCDIVVTGHSHSPYHKIISNTHFINPGSVGRMFDGDPSASCATLVVGDDGIKVTHFRIPYAIDKVVTQLRQNDLPEIYCTMYRQGRKLN